MPPRRNPPRKVKTEPTDDEDNIFELAAQASASRRRRVEPASPHVKFEVRHLDTAVSRCLRVLQDTQEQGFEYVTTRRRRGNTAAPEPFTPRDDKPLKRRRPPTPIMIDSSPLYRDSPDAKKRATEEKSVDDMTPEELRKELKYTNNVIKANGKVIAKMEGEIKKMDKENSELRKENTGQRKKMEVFRKFKEALREL
ncbi:hypothetical protein K440DRAFT_635926 [Wilcoxina mikolae CBS 423.85]|nr:hypothetical protein K440DRAFT_635926 [Wilcoxina mikolae CBS 423.85]